MYGIMVSNTITAGKKARNTLKEMADARVTRCPSNKARKKNRLIS
jgi:hypothetical protein